MNNATSLRLVNVKVDWMENYANDPHITVTFAAVMNDGSEEPIKGYGSDIYESLVNVKTWSQKGRHVMRRVGDFVQFHSVCERKQGGYSGRSFTFHLDDGTVWENMGAWSSNSMNINSLYRTQVVEVASNMGGCAVTIEALAAWIKNNPECGFTLTEVEWLGEGGKPYYVITKPDGAFKNPEHCKHHPIKRIA